MSTGQRAPKGERGPSEAPRLKTVKVPAKLHTDKPSELEFVPGTGPLKGSFTVVVSGGGNHRQFTIHHPIGVTNLSDDDWVITRTDEIQSLLARSVNPNKQRIDQSRAEERLKLAEAAGLLVKNTATGQYDYPGGVDRTAIIEAARSKANAEMKRVRNLQKEMRTGADTGGKTPTVSILDFLSKEDKEREEKVRAFMTKAETSKRVEEKFPDTFQTCSGPTASVPQVGASSKGNIPYSANQAFDEIVKQIVQATLSNGPKRPSPPSTPPQQNVVEVVESVPQTKE